ncbi:MAG: M28 family peptidase [candidate division Zixibacteria bacterium]|nr:M28 family peptidase [candidate division Zixibacteria bacterium]
MFWRKVWLGGLGAFLTILFLNLSLASGSVLIRIELKTAKDYQLAAEVGLKAYVRLDKAYLGEIEKDKIEKLEVAKIPYQIIDETPFTQDYFLVSKTFFRAKANLSDYGQVLLDEDDLTLLKTDQNKALELLNAGYRLTRITPQVIPLKYTPPPSLAIPALSFSPERDTLVDQVSVDSITSYLLKLQAYDTRFVYSDSIVKARHWLYSKFKEFGIDSVYFYPFTAWDGYIRGNWMQDSNVVAVIPGTAAPDKVIVVGGHYDSVNWGMWNFNDPAPGADDNGSGTAATLEIARILAHHPLSKTVIFMPFAAEEVGLLGSSAYAYDAASQGKDIQLMINFDMIAHWPNSTEMNIHTYPPSLPYALLLVQMAGTYTNLTPHILGNSSGSDSWPFSQVGYNIIYSAERIFSDNWHLITDSVTNMNIPYMSQIVRMNLATLIEVAESPGPVENLQVMDAGDGEKLYLNWAPLQENNLVGYKVYSGTQSGVYTDTHFVAPTVHSDTLRNLQTGVPYYMAVAAVNNLGKESFYKIEIIGTPRSIPLAPSGLTAQTGYFKINLSWQSNQEADLAYYKVYRSLSSGSGFDSIATGIKGFSYQDSALQGGIWYYYCITAVDTLGNESSFSQEARMIAITLDQGVLVIDETGNSMGNPPMPSSDFQQDSLYSELFSGYQVSFYEYTDISTQPSIIDLGPYSTVVWLDDDFQIFNFVTDKDDNLIKEYLGYGGRFILFSWTGLRRFAGTLPKTFSAGSFVYDYLHISWANENPVNDFAGAFPYDTIFYLDIKSDTLKYISDWQGRLKYVNIFNLRPGAQPLYYFDSYSDNPAYEGKVCGLKYDGTDYKLAFFGLPLYYLEAPGAKEMVRSLMQDFGEPLGVEDHPNVSLPERYMLAQNYPNPFNPTTTLPFSLKVQGSTFKGPIHATLKIYNILGQLVRTLVDEEKAAGSYKIIWDGKDNSGKEVGSGIYFYQLKTEEYTATKKMVLLR